MAGTFSFLGLDTGAESGGDDEDTPKSIVEICQEAMDYLIKGRVQWDEVPDNTQEPTIETVKQWLTRYSARDETPTVLHALAKAPNLCGRAKKHAVLDPVVQQVLEHFGSDREVEEFSPGGLASDPILQVAIKTWNKVFINSIKAVWLEGYPELVDSIQPMLPSCKEAYGRCILPFGLKVGQQRTRMETPDASPLRIEIPSSYQTSIGSCQYAITNQT